MATIDELVEQYRDRAEPRDGLGGAPFWLASRLEPPATRAEIADAWRAEAPPELVELWLRTREAWLFVDVDHGQWGMHVLSPADSAARTRDEVSRRPADLGADDTVVAEFLGDSELLVHAAGEPETRRVLVAGPLDRRPEWLSAGATLTAVLDGFLAHRGGKYWEGSASNPGESPTGWAT